MMYAVYPGQDAQAVVDAAQNGDTVVFQPGVHPAPQREMGVTVNGQGISLIGQGAILDGGSTLHSWINFGGASDLCSAEGFVIRNTVSAGIWSNSGGGKRITIRSAEMFGGLGGIYTDAGASDWVIDNCNFHDIGRTSDAGNSYDQCIYSHGSNMLIRGCRFSGMMSGWGIQCAEGFSGKIIGNTFNGPNQYDSKPGQIMLWGNCGPIDISYNQFNNPRAMAVTDYQFTSTALTGTGNIVTGGASMGFAETGEDSTRGATPIFTPQAMQSTTLAATIPVPPNMRPMFILAGVTLLIYLISD